MPSRSYVTFPLNGPLAAPLVFVTNALPAGQVGTPYSFQYQAAGGTPPYTFSLVGSTGTNTWHVSASGLLTGTPGNVETDTVSAKVVDSRGNSALTGPLTLVVIAASNYVFTLFISTVAGGANDANDGSSPVPVGPQPGIGPWTLGSLLNQQTIFLHPTAKQIANNNAMAGQQVGFVGDQGVLSLADAGITYPTVNGANGNVLSLPNGLGPTQPTVAASCNSSKAYVPRLAVLDGGISTQTVMGAVVTNVISSFDFFGRSTTNTSSLDLHDITVDGFEIRNCMNSGVCFRQADANLSDPRSPGCVGINNYIHHVYNANEGAQVIGSVAGGPAGTGVLTVTSVTNGTVTPGDAVWNLTNGGGLAGLGAIQAYGTGGGTGTGGVGTYILGVASNTLAGPAAIGTTAFGGNNLAGMSNHGCGNYVQQNNYIADIIDLNNNVQAGANRRSNGIKNWTSTGGTVQFNTIYATAATGQPTGGIEFKNVPQVDYTVAQNYINLANAGPYPTEDVIGCAGDGETSAVTAPDGHFANWNNNIIIANPNGAWGFPGVVGGPQQSPLIVKMFNNTMVSNGAHGNVGRLGTKGATDQIFTYKNNIIDRGTANSSGNGGDWRFTSISFVYIDHNLYPTNFIMVLRDATTLASTTYSNSPLQNGGLTGCMNALTAASTPGGTPTQGLEAHVQLGQALYVNASRSNASGKKASDWQLTAASPGHLGGDDGTDMGAWGGGVTQIGCNFRDPSMNP